MPRQSRMIREAGATQNGVLIAKCLVPRGTDLVVAEIDDEKSKVLFVFKVKWFAVPWYLGRAVYAMLQQGMSFHVWVDKMDRPSSTIKLTEKEVISEPQVH